MLAYIIEAIAIAAWFAVLGRVVMSWLDPTFSRPLGRSLFSLTEPVLAPIRRALPRTGAFDFSPLVVLLVLSVLIRVVLYR